MTAKEFFNDVTRAEHELYLIRKRQPKNASLIVFKWIGVAGRTK